MLNRSGKCGHPCLVLEFNGKTFNFSLLSMILSVGLSYFVEICFLHYAEMCFLYIHLTRVFIMNGWHSHVAPGLCWPQTEFWCFAMPAHMPVALLRHSVKCKSPLSLTANHCPKPLPPLPSRESQGMSCGRAATVSDLGCFWGSVWVSTKSGHCHSTPAPCWDQVASMSHSWVFNSVMAGPDPVLQCDKEHSLSLSWGL